MNLKPVVLTLFTGTVLAEGTPDLAPPELTVQNYASIEQVGNTNRASIDQLGAGNRATITQSGSNDTAIIVQVGTGNVATITQGSR